jgi:hypothetical protein
VNLRGEVSVIVTYVGSAISAENNGIKIRQQLAENPTMKRATSNISGSLDVAMIEQPMNCIKEINLDPDFLPTFLTMGENVKLPTSPPNG